MRRKNRQIKITVDIPEGYDSDDEFMEDMMDTMDNNGWNMQVDGERVPVSKMVLGEVEIEPEEEE